MYDSIKDTYEHIRNVQNLLSGVLWEVIWRMKRHDESKLLPPEKPMYDEFTPLLRGLTYGSDEYKDCLAKMGPALQHHYEANNHHPEHYENGINGMSLLDLIEMLADWKAASLRHEDGDILKSLEINKQRFGVSDQLAQIFENTIREMRWDGTASIGGPFPVSEA